MTGDGEGVASTKPVPLRLRIIGYALAAIVGIVMLPYLLFRTFVVMIRVFAKEWWWEFAKQWGRRHVRVSPDGMNEARLRDAPDR